MTVRTHNSPLMCTAMFDLLATGEVSFLICRDETGPQRGDRLIVREWTETPDCDNPEPRSLECSIAFVLAGEQWGLKAQYVALGLVIDAPA